MFEIFVTVQHFPQYNFNNDMNSKINLLPPPPPNHTHTHLTFYYIAGTWKVCISISLYLSELFLFLELIMFHQLVVTFVGDVILSNGSR